MLLHVLMTKIIAYIETNPDEHGCKFLGMCAQHNGMDLKTYILSLPVNAISEVRDYVPMAFPRKLRKGKLRVSQNIHQAWRVDLLEV